MIKKAIYDDDFVALQDICDWFGQTASRLHIVTVMGNGLIFTKMLSYHLHLHKNNDPLRLCSQVLSMHPKSMCLWSFTLSKYTMWIPTKKVRGQFVCQVLIFQFENLFDNLIRSTFLFHNWDNVLSFNFLEKYSALSSSVSSFNHNFYSTLQINSEFEWDLKHEAAELTPFL